MDKFYTQFDNVFFEKTRLSIITILYKEGVVSFNRFKKMLGGTDGAIYTHLKKLIESGYISYKKEIVNDNAQTNYSITPSGKKIFKEYLKFIQGIITEEKRK
jgi:predicted transcriptional regulator